ncbi:MAG: RNA polymerase sigma factor [Proteobacteria bacterium]|nr:RNA polymerase sigma factor [Pseudomonadota bacterium]
MNASIEDLAQAAKQGDRLALGELVGRIQDRIYGLALKMLGHPQDAEDEAQEILIKIITALSGFRGESSFQTWMYRIASNHLLTSRASRAEKIGFPLEQAENQGRVLESDAPWAPSVDPETRLLVEEVRLRCLQAMLLCLNRKDRLAFVLGEVFEVTGREGAEIFDVTPAAFRKRLSRARDRVAGFMKNCELVRPSAPCRCAGVALDGMAAGWLKPGGLLFADKRRAASETRSMESLLDQWDQMKTMAEVFRSYPEYSAPDSFVSLVKDYMKRVESGIK